MIVVSETKAFEIIFDAVQNAIFFYYLFDVSVCFYMTQFRLSGIWH